LQLTTYSKSLFMTVLSIASFYAFVKPRDQGNQLTRTTGTDNEHGHGSDKSPRNIEKIYLKLTQLETRNLPTTF
ncbi:MAG: hypothetical protein QME81_16520, partial [bacterium]|nr:hypothetical protein [bacterium]